MIGQNVTHANFSVDSIEVAKDFYVNKLGFRVVGDDGYGLMLESGAGGRIFIYPKEDHKAWDSTVLGIEVPDIKATVDELKSAGIVMEKMPMTDDMGIMSDPNMGEAAWFKDPAGNWICINSMS